MKNLLLTIFLFFGLYLMNAQTGINTLTPNATLDIKSSNQASPLSTDGLLIPKIDAFPVTNPTALQDGMMVYLTTNIGLNLKGFYSWDNANVVWKAISTPASTNSWGLTGNAGTLAGTNFIGTIDNVDLIFRRGSFFSGRIGINNTSFGFNSLNTTTGFNNTAIGNDALSSNTSGSNNNAFGSRALLSTTGFSNTAFGSNALTSITTGSGNIGIGSYAAVPSPTADYQMSIGNVIYGTAMNSPSGKIGIGVSNPTEKLDVAGKTKTTNLQVTNGAVAGSVLTSDVLGNASWTAPPTPSQDWGQTGNAGTVAGTNFIGTQDNQDLVFKRWSAFAGRIGDSNTSFGNLTNASIDSNSYFNSSFGVGALYNNTFGQRNTAIGSESLFTSSNSFENTATGYKSMNFNTTGSYNTATGSNSLLNNSTGSFNIALGYGALANNTTGTHNIAIGYQSNPADPTGHNQLSIGSVIYGTNVHSLANGKIGIGTTNPGERLDVVGKTKTTDLQITNGASIGNVLKSDAAGNATWQPANFWGQTGNIGTNATTNFIGTIDYVDLVFKRGNVQSGRIGFWNNAFGREALLSNTTGNDLTAIGNGSLKNNTVGEDNTAVGSGSLGFNTIGDFNTAVGNSSLLSNISGYNNSAFGVGTLLLNTIGYSNTAAGLYALRNSTTGYNNTAIGANAGANITTGSENIAIGANTNMALGIGSNQLNIGNQIFGTGLTGSSIAPVGNIGIGVFNPTNTLEIKSNTANTSGLTFTNLTSTSPSSIGTAIGVNATGQVITVADGSLNNWSKTGNAGTTPSTNFIGTTDDIDLVFKRNNVLSGIITTDNLSFGYDALTSNTTGNGNTAIGSFALKANTLGFNNTALGTGTLQNNTSTNARRNTAIGAYAMQFNTTGQDNTAVGSSALALISTGTGNTAVGQGALFQLQSGGSENTVVGRESMSGSNNSGARNSALGAWILRSNTTGGLNTAAGYTSLNANTTGSNNAVYGAEGLFSNTTGSNNTAIGYKAGRNASSTGGNNIMIGANAEVPSGTASNQISIANLIYATGATSVANAGNVGIGTNAPSTKFEVVGTAKATILQSTALQTTNFQMTAGASNNFVLRSDASGNANWVNSNSLAISESDPKIGGQSTNYVPKWNGSQLVQGVIHDNGFVGINTNSPQAQFHVAGSNFITSPSLQRSLFSAFSGSNINQDASSQSGNIILRADGWIWSNGGGFVATSDARIKNIKGITNNQKDLVVLNQIEITDYKYKDEITNGSTEQKKVIAQQLKSVYPIAVNQSTGVIPNVFEVAKASKIINQKTEITTTKLHDFATDDEVKLILDKSGEKTFKVTVLNPNTFTIDAIINETIFVYGKKVNDLLNVDYDALTTLNISATQELIKRIQTLEKENSNLKTENTQNNKTIQAMLSDIQNIKNQLNSTLITSEK